MVLIKPATRNEASNPLRPYNEIINGSKQITKNAYVNEDGTNSSLRKDLRYTACAKLTEVKPEIIIKVTTAYVVIKSFFTYVKYI